MPSRKLIESVEASKQDAQDLKNEPKKSLKENKKDFAFVSFGNLGTWPDPEWYLLDFVPKRGTGQIFGESGAGKSFLALDLAYALATGNNWFGWEFDKEKNADLPSVFYLCLEGQAGFKKRCTALEQREAKKRNLDKFAVPNLFLSKEPFDITNTDHIKVLVQQINGIKSKNPPIVFIDTQAQAMPTFDENSSKDMGLLLKQTNLIQQHIDGLVFLIAHAGKSGVEKGARGWSGQKAPMDVQIAVERRKEDNLRQFTAVKVKDGIDGIMCGFSLCSRIVGMRKDGKPETSCTVEPENLPTRGKLSSEAQERLEALQTAYQEKGISLGSPISVTEWKKTYMKIFAIADAEKAKNDISNARTALLKAKIISADSKKQTVTLLLDKP